MLSRRAFLSAVAASSATTLARAQTSASSAPPTVLRIERRSIEVNGKPASVFGVRQPDGTFGIRTEVGKRFRVRLENKIDEPSLIHWHGLTPPWQQDDAGLGRRIRLGEEAEQAGLLDLLRPG